MQAISYYLVIPFLYGLAYLPSPVLYRMARLLAWLLNRLIGYRKKVVYENLHSCFPEKSAAEIAAIADESYLHLAYHVVENIKCMTITVPEVEKRMKAVNIELLNEEYAKGKHVVLLLGHIAAWEYGGYKLSANCRHKLYGIVSLVSNPYFNRMIQRTRGKMGMELVGMKFAKEFFQRTLQQPSLIIFIGDQSPSNKERAYWTTFFNRDTAFFDGGERYARQHNCTVVYPKIVWKKEGYYEAELIKITDNPAGIPPHAITEKFVRLLEQQIREHPADWLWSHKRWKHQRH